MNLFGLFVELDTMVKLLRLSGYIIFISTTAFAFFRYYLPGLRLVWKVFYFDKHPLISVFSASYSCFTLKRREFRKSIRIWVELRILYPKPTDNFRWLFNPKTKKFFLDVNQVGLKNETRDWKQEIDSKFLTLITSNKEPVIEVENVFSLNEESVKDKIDSYFYNTSKLKLINNEERSFVCMIKIRNGFLLPLNLLTGLLSQFKEDWDPLINSYSNDVNYCFSSYQLSQLNLWLLWGLSTSICTCSQWEGSVTLQYGFGDENNSIRVRVSDEKKQLLLSKVHELSTMRQSLGYPNIPCSVLGRIWYSNRYSRGELCGAQNEQTNPDKEPFILEYENHSINGLPGGKGFYSAYVWILFLISQPEDRYEGGIRIKPEQNLIPFFEHSNIIDGDCLARSKSNVIDKVIKYCMDLLKTAPKFKLSFLCSFDESGCGMGLAVQPYGPSLSQLLKEKLESINDDTVSSTLLFDDSTFQNYFNACHLTSIINNYMQSIGKNY